MFSGCIRCEIMAVVIAAGVICSFIVISAKMKKV